MFLYPDPYDNIGAQILFLLRPTINTGISNESPNAIVYINIKDTKLDIPIVTSAPTPMSKLAKI